MLPGPTLDLEGYYTVGWVIYL